MGRGTRFLLFFVLVIYGTPLVDSHDIKCGCENEDTATSQEGLCYNKGECSSLKGSCTKYSIQCGGCEYDEGSVKIGAPPELFDLSGAGFRRGIRFRLKAYGSFTWTAVTSCSVAKNIGSGLQLSSEWTISPGIVDWIGTQRLLSLPIISLSWKTAQSRCISLGGRLATLRDYLDIRNSSVSSPYLVPCLNCWAGLPFGQRSWTLPNGDSISPRFVITSLLFSFFFFFFFFFVNFGNLFIRACSFKLQL